MDKSNTMRAARLHKTGEPFHIDEIPVPEVRPTDVLVRVSATSMVPNLRNVISIYSTYYPRIVLPKLPAVYGLDATGVVTAVGSLVKAGVMVGDRVYVNPALTCGSCEACRRADPTNCGSFAFMGYFGFGPDAQHRYEAYPYGGFSEFLTAPVANIVKLPDCVTFEQGARFGYLGTSYAALRKARFAPGQSLTVNGATGTLGVGTVLLGLAMGAARIFAVGRDPARLQQLRALDPRRVFPVSSKEGPVGPKIKASTDGAGVDVMIEALAPGASADSVIDAMGSLRPGGIAVNVGGVTERVSFAANVMMNYQWAFMGSRWFSTSEGQDMANMADAGTLRLDVFEDNVFPLDRVNEALDAIDARNGGFSNFVIKP